jgi:hypothetical protein
LSSKIGQSLGSSFRTQVNGWIRVHVEGEPGVVGFQHGYHLAAEIIDTIIRIREYVEVNWGWSWDRLREISKQMYEDKILDENREEMEGIARGVNAKPVDTRIRSKIDFFDILTLNGFFDSFFYYNSIRKKDKKNDKGIKGLGHCSAFIASGTSTRGGGIVLAHNTWLNYDLANSNVLLSLRPMTGYEIFMETMPGSIQGCGIDCYINSAGLMVTNTTLSGMKVFNEDGIPYFVRARQAIQYATSIEDWTKELLRENNGGNAAGWLVGNRRTGDIAYLELGTYQHVLDKVRDGYFCGCNMAYGDAVRQETEIDYQDRTASSSSRDLRCRQLLSENEGKIDIEVAKNFLADHSETSLNRAVPSRGTLCGHVEDDERGWPEWDCGPFYPFGAADAFITDSELTEKGCIWARWGKPCGCDFKVEYFLRKHPEYGYLRKNLKDIISYPWTFFKADFERRTKAEK